MDKETRYIELMKISATLTLARCTLSASPEKIEPAAADSLVDNLFNEYMDRLNQKMANVGY